MVSLLRSFLILVLALSVSLLSATEDRSLRVALYADDGAGNRGIITVEGQLLDAGHEVKRVKGEEIADGILASGFDVVVFTGGSGSRQGSTLGETGRENVRQFVREGGGYVGICAGAYLACTNFSWGVGVLNARTVSPRWRRGQGIVEVEVTAAGAETSGIAVGTHEIRYANGPIITHHDREDIPPFETVAYFRTELAENNTPEGIMIDAPAIARGTFGKGRVVVSSPHPESTAGMEGTFAPYAVRWAAGATQKPTRHLIAVGGGPVSDEMRALLLSLSPIDEPSLLIIPHAAREHQLQERGEAHTEHFRGVGANQVEVLDLTDPEAARAAIERADAIWMPGGIQRRLMEALDEAGVADAVRARYAAGIPVAGTSAGAAIMSETMIASSRRDEESGNLIPIISHGLGFWQDAIIDQHFSERNRLSRLEEAVRQHPALIGIGIDEGTAVVFNGSQFNVIGDSTVTVVRALDSGNGAEVELETTVLQSGEAYDWPLR